MREDSSCPVRDFLESLSEKALQKVAWVLRLITELRRIPTTYLKKVKGSADIWESRIQLGSDTYRLFGFFDGGDLIVLTHGMRKKSRKTPKDEIRRAENLKREYFRRSE